MTPLALIAPWTSTESLKSIAAPPKAESKRLAKIVPDALISPDAVTSPFITRLSVPTLSPNVVLPVTDILEPDMVTVVPV